jgi:hypothetical protein
MGVSDAARADLKREMEKVGIRATTMGEILADVIGKNSATPAATESQPPSAPSRLPSTRPIVAAKASGSLLQEAPETPVATPAADVEIAPVYVCTLASWSSSYSLPLGGLFEGSRKRVSKNGNIFSRQRDGAQLG